MALTKALTLLLCWSFPALHRCWGRLLLTVVMAAEAVACSAPIQQSVGPSPRPPVDRIVGLPENERRSVEPAGLLHLMRGLLFLKSGRGSAAVPHLRLAMVYSPASSFVHEQLGKAWELAGNLDKASETVRRGLDVTPNDPWLRSLAGRLALRLGKYNEAVEHLESVSHAQDATSAPTLIAALAWNQQREEALAVAKRLLVESSVKPEVLHGIAAVLEEHALLDVSLQAYERVRALQPTDVVAVAGEVRVLGLLGRPADAATRLVKYLPYADHPAQVVAEIMRRFDRAGRPEAKAYREQALRMSRTNPEARVALAFADWSEGHTFKARELLKKTVREYPNHRYARLLLAEIHAHNRNPKACLAALGEDGSVDADQFLREKAWCFGLVGRSRRMVEMLLRAHRAGVDVDATLQDAAGYLGRTASNLVARSRLRWLLKGLAKQVPDGVLEEGVVLLARARLEDSLGHAAVALHLARRAVAARPENLDARLLAADLEFRHGDADKALQTLDALVREDPHDPARLNALGYALADASVRLPEASVWLRRAYRLAPEEGAVIDSLGWLMFRQGQMDAALLLLKRASRVMRGEPEVLFHLGEVYRAMGKDKDARFHYRRALQASPRRALRLQIERRLAAMQGIALFCGASGHAS